MKSNISRKFPLTTRNTVRRFDSSSWFVAMPCLLWLL
jgi:hypothetical protein